MVFSIPSLARYLLDKFSLADWFLSLTESSKNVYRIFVSTSRLSRCGDLRVLHTPPIHHASWTTRRMYATRVSLAPIISSRGCGWAMISMPCARPPAIGRARRRVAQNDACTLPASSEIAIWDTEIRSCGPPDYARLCRRIRRPDHA